MDVKGNERMLCFSNITELTGEDDHQRVTELDVIFGPYEDIDAHAFRQCANLRNLTLINCRLNRIPILALDAVRASLVHLCLSAQQIAMIEPLDLPNLRFLYLQQNQLERIEGLDTCRRLQILWLYGNRIRRIEGLGQCTDLRELWLQDNAIQSLSASESDPGLRDLVNLESLCLAKNRIRNIDELQALRNLINLRTLVLTDEHFGSNPVVRHPEYRTVVIASLHHLISLDGICVEYAEREGAADRFLQHALAFNNIVTDLTLSYEQELRMIQTRKEKGQSNAEMMQRELIEALNEVEQLVVRGMRELDDEKQHQFRLRDGHAQLTAEVLKNIEERYKQELEQMLEVELKNLEEEETYLDVLQQEAAAQHRLSLTLTTLMCAFPQLIVVERLLEHTADYQHIATHIDAGFSQGQCQLLEIFRFYHADLSRRFEMCLNSKEPPPAAGAITHLYCAVSEDEIVAVLQSGFERTQEASSKWCVLFSSPMQALRFSEGTPGTIGELDDGDIDYSRTTTTGRGINIRSHILLVCEVLMSNAHQVTIGDQTVKQLGSLNSIISLATATTTNPEDESGGNFIQVRISFNQHEGDIYIADRKQGLPNVVPQFIMLCSQQHQQRQVLYSSDTSVFQPESVLPSFMRDVKDEVASHYNRLWKELEPEVLTRNLQLQPERQRIENDISFAKDRIEQEKKTQRRLLKTTRPQK